MSKLDNYIRADCTCSKIVNKIYLTYKRLLNKQDFTKIAVSVERAKLKYLKNTLSSSRMATEEENYYHQYFNKIVNILMDSLTMFIQTHESDRCNALRFINDRWQSLYEYWINDNKNTALDDQWIISIIKQPPSKQPSNFKVMYKMFVLCCVIRTEVLHYTKLNYDYLPQFLELYSQLKVMSIKES